MEGDFLIWVQENLRVEGLNSIMVFITSLGNAGFIWVVTAIALIIYPPTRKMGILAGISMAITFILVNLLIKEIVARPRPFDVIEELMPLVKRPTDYAFPSGHTANAFASAIIYFKCMKKYRYIPIAAAVAIALSRLYVGVHYPTDVIGGGIIAFLVAQLVYKVAKMYKFIKV